MSGLESLDDGADTNTEAQTLMQMMKTMMESHSSLEKQVAELMQKQHSRSRLPTPNDLDESFNLKDIHLSEDTFARTPSVRRSSLLLNDPRLKKENQAQRAHSH
jgi:leucyl aminopeptidase (aminopeptidase T)